MEEFSDFSANIDFLENRFFFSPNGVKVHSSEIKPIVFLCQFLCGMSQAPSECDKLFIKKDSDFMGQVGNIKIKNIGYLTFELMDLTQSQSAKLSEMENTYSKLRI